MNLQGALAALLLTEGRHGYELVTILEAELGPVWSTRASQVYLTLGRMGRNGFVRSRRVPQPNRPDRQLLTLTDPGRGLAEAWLWEPSGGDEVVVRLAIARISVPDRFAELAEAISRERTAELHRLRATRRELPSDEGFGQDAIEREIRQAEADLRWVTRVHESAAAIVGRRQARRRAILSVVKLA